MFEKAKAGPKRRNSVLPKLLPGGGGGGGGVGIDGKKNHAASATFGGRAGPIAYFLSVADGVAKLEVEAKLETQEKIIDVEEGMKVGEDAAAADDGIAVAAEADRLDSSLPTTTTTASAPATDSVDTIEPIPNPPATSIPHYAPITTGADFTITPTSLTTLQPQDQDLTFTLSESLRTHTHDLVTTLFPSLPTDVLVIEAAAVVQNTVLSLTPTSSEPQCYPYADTRRIVVGTQSRRRSVKGRITGRVWWTIRNWSRGVADKVVFGVDAERGGTQLDKGTDQRKKLREMSRAG
ncbi:hypothetical protein HK104_002715 [Borealophlyctis nickersoniae]|nr:hypothetical protein HK104_002715 [Borealophlyctis nickersoniae]